MTKKITPAHLKKHGKRHKIPDSLSHSQAELALRMREFLEYLKLKNYSPSTIKLRRLALNYFLRWCSDRSVETCRALASDLLALYENHLRHAHDADNKPFSAQNRHGYLEAVGRLCKWLVEQDILPHNPAHKLSLPKIAKEPPAQILRHQEIELIVAQADVKTPCGLRNRALMELLYSTGMRRAEAAALMVTDVDVGNGLVTIRHGKGDKARVVPLGERACQWVGKYLLEARGLLAKGKKTNALWLSQYGRQLSAEVLAQLVHACVVEAGLSGSCHIFRHAMASQMLDNGADLCSIQEMLGHEQLSTTQIYTHPSIEKIEQVYSQTHPANAHAAPADGPLTQTIRRRPRHVTTKPGSRIAWPQNELSRWAEIYLASLRLARYSAATIELSERHLKSFVLYCQERQITQVQELTVGLVQLYHKQLLSKQAQQLTSSGYTSGKMKAVRLFCAFLTERQQLTSNIADKLAIPRKKKSFPCQILSSQEVERMLQQPDITTPLGLRDRAVIEILYATGLTRQELITLRVEDILFAQASVLITKPRNGERRMVPVPASVLAWVEKYLREVRPLISDEQGGRALFLGMHGLPLCKVDINVKLQRYARKAGITKPVTCIQLRHAMAAAMLDNGADLRHVQEILGHRALHSTQVYTKVAIRKLKEVHTKTHPARSKTSHDAASGHDVTDDHDASEKHDANENR